MTTLGDLNPMWQAIVESLRRLKREDLTNEDRAWLRAIAVEVNWLLGQAEPEPEADDQPLA
jgi:hypothetical protein